MEERPGDGAIESALRAERRFVLALGGFALEFPGGTLVTHEKIPSPRLNFVEVGGVAVDRQAAFFERALDHYFQRALRPRFRVPEPAPEHVDRALRRFAFRPGEAPLRLYLEDEDRAPDPGRSIDLDVEGSSDLDLLSSFWTEPSERPELRSALDVALHHPIPGEELRPLLGRVGPEAASAALVYRAGGAAMIHFVTTRPQLRERGAASALVAHARAHRPPGPHVRYSILSDSTEIAPRLRALGFAPAAQFVEYSLPREAELALPPAGPPGPPRWRPPR